MLPNPYMNPFVNQFPYMDCHEMNLDWIIKTVKMLDNKVETYTILNTISYQGEWLITKQYTKWSVVFYNGLGYLSLQPVPGNVPISNTDYWMVIAPYAPEDHFDEDSMNPVQNSVITAKFAEISEDISDEASAREEADNTLGGRIDDEETARENADNTLSGRIDDAELAIAKLSNYVTPEMVGTIDTEAHANAAIADAITYAEAHNVPVCIFSNITYSSPIVLPSRNIKFYVFGTLTYTGSDFAIKCKYPRQTVYVYRLLAANGGGIKVDTSDYSVEFLNVRLDFAECLQETFLAITSSNNHITYVKCSGRLWQSSSSYDCIRVEKGSGGSFIGEVAFFDIKVMGLNGLHVKGPSVSAVRAIRLSVEDISDTGFIVDSAISTDIIDCRYAELQGRNGTVIEMIGAIGLKFTGNYTLKISSIDDTQLNTASSNAITFYCPIAHSGGALISNGLRIMPSGYALQNPKLTNKVFADTDVDVDGYTSGGYVQTIRMNTNDDCTINLSKFHIAETYPYIAVNIPGAHDYTIKDHNGTTIATINGYGQYMITLDYNHFVFKKS